MQHLAKRAQKHHTRDRRIYLFSLLLVALFAAWILWPSPADLLQEARAGHSLRIGFAEEAPFAFTTPDGRVSGEAPEIARLVAAHLGIPPSAMVFRALSFSELIPVLTRGEIDLVASGMFITSEREKEVRFSHPTESVSPGLLVQRGNPLGLHSYRELLQLPTVRIAVLSGSVEEEYFLRSGFDKTRLRSVSSANKGLDFVEDGSVDGLALSVPTLYWRESQSSTKRTEILLLQDPPPELFGTPAFTFRLRDEAFVGEWNRALDEVMRSPEFKTIQRKFGFLGPVEAHDSLPARKAPSP